MEHLFGLYQYVMVRLVFDADEAVKCDGCFHSLFSVGFTVTFTYFPFNFDGDCVCVSDLS